MKHRRWTAVAIGVLAALPVSLHGQEARPVAQFTTAELIDRLQKTSNDDFAVRTNIIAMGNDGNLTQGLLKLHDPGPKPAEFRTELIRRGATSLPDLLAHLDDARRTKASVSAMSIMVYRAEYDWNSRTGRFRPIGVDPDLSLRDGVKIVGAPGGGSYTLTVGDLCFEILGDVVNRRYDAVRYQPSGCIVVNSPVLCPSLCAAVRREWGGVTAREHRDLLNRDVAEPDRWGRAAGGIRALARYYPEDVPTAARKRLALPLFGLGATREFAETALYPNGDAMDRKRLIAEFIARNGPSYKDGLIIQLWKDRSDRVGQKIAFSDPIQFIKTEPKQILVEMGAKVDPDYGPLVNAVPFSDQANFIASMSGIPSPEVDAAVWDEFTTHRAQHSDEWGPDDWIAEECITRLLDKGHDTEFREFVKRRLTEIKGNAVRAYKLLELLGNCKAKTSE